MIKGDVKLGVVHRGRWGLLSCISTRFFVRGLLGLLLLFLFKPLFAQNAAGSVLSGTGNSSRAIVTSVPFLSFAPDARGAGLGDLGAATPPTINAVHWNNAKLAFYNKDRGGSFSYTPWLARLVNDMYVGYLTGFKRINQLQSVGLTVRYFDLGDIHLTDMIGNTQGTFSPRDISIDGTYARKLSDHMSLGVTLRYLQSNLSRAYSQQQTGRTANGVSIDLGYYYNRDGYYLFGNPSTLSLGAHVSNVGNKITYTNENNENFVPANLRIGTAVNSIVNEYHSFLFALDLNKLLVPSPPIYQKNENGFLAKDENGNLIVEKGMDPRRSVIATLGSSFYDAPDGLREELQEIGWSLGTEYWYRNFFAFRTGYHHEHQNKGNRKYLNLGSGFRYSIFGIDFAYLVPFQRNHPLGETLRFTILFVFDKSETANNAPISP